MTLPSRSAQAAALKSLPVAEGLWSQYLEVGIGPDAEIFTKGQVLSAVGTAVPVGVLAASTWNNPEPEVALIVSSSGRIGATLGNDVNLRDVVGRSALLLPMAKDNNASCALGPLIRLFDDRFDLERVRRLEVSLAIDGDDGFRLEAVSGHDADVAPSGSVGTAADRTAPLPPRRRRPHARPHVRPVQDRDRHAEGCDPWDFGVRDLMGNLVMRGLL